MEIKAYRIDPERHVRPVKFEERLLREAEAPPVWVDIVDGKEDEVRELLAHLELPAAVFEALFDTDRLARLSALERAVYLEFPVLADVQAKAPPVFVSAILLDKVLVTVRPHNASLPEIPVMRDDDDYVLRTPRVGAMLFEILDALHDDVFVRVREIRAKIDTLGAALQKDEIMSYNVADFLSMKRLLSRLEHLNEDHLYAVTQLSKLERETFAVENLRGAYRQLQLQFEYSDRLIDRLDNRLEEYHDYFQSLLQGRTDRRLRLLSVISAIFLPLTFIAGVYGMNFEIIPGLHWRYGYHASMAGMALLAGGLMVFFWKRGWFD